RDVYKRQVLLTAHPETCDSLAELLGWEGAWEAEAAEPSGAVLVGRYPETAVALDALLTGA
ncbi:hypothetical protein, partial [Streptomyces sp. NRRL S-15]|uniref:hypothetical protein n=1 Tax=Streptomyces sp. NRRL S-15 TaxID=1463886 RepID=UPI001F1D54BD